MINSKQNFMRHANIRLYTKQKTPEYKQGGPVIENR